jgi:hypothetical protein
LVSSYTLTNIGKIMKSKEEYSQTRRGIDSYTTRNLSSSYSRYCLNPSDARHSVVGAHAEGRGETTEDDKETDEIADGLKNGKGIK